MATMTMSALLVAQHSCAPQLPTLTASLPECGRHVTKLQCTLFSRTVGVDRLRRTGVKANSKRTHDTAILGRLVRAEGQTAGAAPGEKDKTQREKAPEDETSGRRTRRDALAAVLAVAGSAVALPLVPAGAHADPLLAPERANPVGAEFGELYDVLNAYEFKYPLSLPKGTKLSWVETRKPERYSSAAPLSPDAKQRIVAERLDYKNNLVISVSVGPPNRSFLSSAEPREWAALNVARSVLVDKSAARLTPEQRLKEIDIDNVWQKEMEGNVYWYYEYLTQKSPTITDYSADVYRHSLAVSAAREGYIYSLNVSALDSRWPIMEPVLREAIESFHLMPVTSDYVPPWKDPWRFW